jgi:hypothetical protein
MTSSFSLPDSLWSLRRRSLHAGTQEKDTRRMISRQLHRTGQLHASVGGPGYVMNMMGPIPLYNARVVVSCGHGGVVTMADGVPLVDAAGP